MQKDYKIGDIVNFWQIDDLNNKEYREKYGRKGVEVHCINCGFKKIGRIDNFTRKDVRPCPNCHQGRGKEYMKLVPGLEYNNCILIKNLNIKREKEGQLWLVKDNTTNRFFTRGSYRLAAGENWHSNERSVYKPSELTLKGRKILDNYGIYHTSDYPFETLKLPNKRERDLQVDEFLPDFHCIIEWDGDQHNLEKSTFFNIERQKESDDFKLKWCDENGYNLIRIPWSKKDSLEIEDLIPGVSKYQVNKKFFIGQ